MTERDSSIRLSWAQFVWGITVLGVLMGAWFDISNRVQRVEAAVSGIYSKSEIDAMKHDADRTHERLEDRIENLERKIGIRADGGRR